MPYPLPVLLRFVLLAMGGWLALAAAPAQAQGVRLAPPPPAADTLRLTLPDAEQRFFANNLQLLAQQYNVTAAQAQAVQARLLDNPTLYVEQDVLRRRLARPDVPVGTASNDTPEGRQQNRRVDVRVSAK